MKQSELRSLVKEVLIRMNEARPFVPNIGDRDSIQRATRLLKVVKPKDAARELARREKIPVFRAKEILNYVISKSNNNVVRELAEIENIPVDKARKIIDFVILKLKNEEYISDIKLQ